MKSVLPPSAGSYQKFERLDLSAASTFLKPLQENFKDISELLLQMAVSADSQYDSKRFRQLEEILFGADLQVLDFKSIDLALENFLLQLKLDFISNKQEIDFKDTANHFINNLEGLLSNLFKLYDSIGRGEDFMHVLMPTRFGDVNIQDFLQQLKVDCGLATYTKTLMPKYDGHPIPETPQDNALDRSRVKTLTGLGQPNANEIISAVGTAKNGFSNITEAVVAAAGTMASLEQSIPPTSRVQTMPPEPVLPATSTPISPVAVPAPDSIPPQPAPVLPNSLIDQAGSDQGYYTENFQLQLGQQVRPSASLTVIPPAPLARVNDQSIVVRQMDESSSEKSVFSKLISQLRGAFSSRTKKALGSTLILSGSVAAAWSVYQSNKQSNLANIPAISVSAMGSNSVNPALTEKQPKQSLPQQGQPNSSERSDFHHGFYQVDTAHDSYQALINKLKKDKLEGIVSITRDLKSQISFLYVEDPKLAEQLKSQGKLVFTGSETEEQLRHAIFKHFLALSQSEKVTHQWAKNQYFAPIAEQYQQFVTTKKWPEKSETSQAFYNAFQKPLQHVADPNITGYVLDAPSLERSEYIQLKKALPGLYTMLEKISKDQEKKPLPINDPAAMKVDICARIKSIALDQRESKDLRSGAGYVMSSECSPNNISGRHSFLNPVVKYSRAIMASKEAPKKEDLPPPSKPTTLIPNTIIPKAAFDLNGPEEPSTTDKFKQKAPKTPSTTGKSKQKAPDQLRSPTIEKTQTPYQKYLSLSKSEKSDLFSSIVKSVSSLPAANDSFSEVDWGIHEEDQAA